MPRWDWHGVAATILALGAAGSVLALAIGSIRHGSVVSELGAALISGSVGTLIGAVATYVGAGRADSPRRLLQLRQPADHVSTPPSSPSGPAGAVQGQPGPSGAVTPLDMRGDVNEDDDS